ncbi:MAG: hypothetical protein ABJB17_08750 [Burkholderiales bacterium]
MKIARSPRIAAPALELAHGRRIQTCHIKHGLQTLGLQLRGDMPPNTPDLAQVRCGEKGIEVRRRQRR